MIARSRSSHALSRRTFLTMAGVAPFAASAMAAMQKTVPVGLELYSVRDELMKDLPGTVTAVAKMGYQVVEFYSPYFDWTPDAAKDVRKLLDGLGIQCRSTHNGPPSFTPEGLKKAIELNQIMGSKNIIMASAGRVDGIAAWEQLEAVRTLQRADRNQAASASAADRSSSTMRTFVGGRGVVFTAGPKGNDRAMRQIAAPPAIRRAFRRPDPVSKVICQI